MAIFITLLEYLFSQRWETKTTRGYDHGGPIEKAWGGFRGRTP